MKYANLFKELKDARLDLGLSQTSVSTKLGVTTVLFRKWEGGQRAVNLEDIDEWATILGYELNVSLTQK